MNNQFGDGGYGQPPYGQQPAGMGYQQPGAMPGPSGGGFPWGKALLGCALIFVLLIGAGAVVTVVLGKKMIEEVGDMDLESLAGKGMDLVKSQFVTMLSPDHDDEQREEFQRMLDALWTEERDRLGLEQWSQVYQAEMNVLTSMTQDETITVEESTAFCEMVKLKLEEQGYYEPQE